MKLKSLYDLIVLYAETNAKVIEQAKVNKTMNLSSELVEITQVLNSLLKVFKELKICMREQKLWGTKMITSSFADYFNDDQDENEPSYGDKPQILGL